MLQTVAHPAIDVDLVYATAANLTGHPIYRHPVALLHADALAALYRAADLARAQGLRLHLFDAFRPQAAQQALWNALPDPTFVADPHVGSTHTRGIAVDLTLADAAGGLLDMGTGFDDMTPQSFHADTSIAPAAQRHRLQLLGLMTVAGWAYHPQEWWHYNLPEPKRYPLIDDRAPEARQLMGA